MGSSIPVVLNKAELAVIHEACQRPSHLHVCLTKEEQLRQEEEKVCFHCDLEDKYLNVAAVRD